MDFIVGGGVARVLHGTPLSTFDLDVVPSREGDNIVRLLAALEQLEAWHRSHPERRLRPDASHLSTAGHQLLMTRFGPLDLLVAIGRSRGYRELLADSAEMPVGGGLVVRVLSLEALITVKQETGDAKDLAALPILQRTLAESRRR